MSERKNNGTDNSRTSRITSNSIGMQPTLVAYDIYPGEFSKKVLEFIRKEIDDFADVTMEYDKAQGKFEMYAWLPSRSKHLIDKDSVIQGGVVSRPVSRISEEMRSFMKTYVDGDQKHLHSAENNFSIKGIRLSMSKILIELFDVFGHNYRKSNPGFNGKVPELFMDAKTMNKERNPFIRLTVTMEENKSRAPKVKRSARF